MAVCSLRAYHELNVDPRVYRCASPFTPTSSASMCYLVIWILVEGLEPTVSHIVISDNRNFSLILSFKNWINQAKNHIICFRLGSLLLLLAPNAVIRVIWFFVKIANSIAWLKNIWLMAEAQISLLYRCWIGLEPHQPIWFLLICRFDTTPRWINRRLYLS